jgi:hypothetical protein
MDRRVDDDLSQDSGDGARGSEMVEREIPTA